jgi:heme-degrading monooxygenase HmoA
MYVVMFEFAVKPGFEAQFIENWPLVTQGIYLFKGSLGSRLHKSASGEYIAYAQWPTKSAWRVSTDITMSKDYEQYRQNMHQALNLQSTKIIYQMEVEIDYLQLRPFALC